MKKVFVLAVGLVLFFLLISCNLSNLFKKECQLTCDANAAPNTGVAPLSVVFMGNATVTGCKETPIFSWDFGDGQFSQSQNTSHIYNNAGTYVWTLTVTAGGKQCTKSGSVTVEKKTYHSDYTEPSTPTGKGNAGVGIKLVTNLRTGVFRVKINDELKAETSFSNQASGKNVLKPNKLFKAKDYEWAKEFKVPAGDCKIKLVIEDNQGSRGAKTVNLNLKPGQHQFLRVVVRGAPGDMRVEM